ncbi:MAG: CRTAC1 family protein [Planctomycetes bacterium]|nr:CRTAC1 family protein [Planctomycetota bacterium]
MSAITSAAAVRSCRPDILPRLTDITDDAGIHFRRYDDIGRLHRIQESLGGGVALFDYDGDGRLDIFLPNGRRLGSSSADKNYPNHFYRRGPSGRFAEVADLAGLRHDGFCHGCAVGDYNSDGFDDLYVTALDRNVLWRNNGDGTFTDVTRESGAQTPRWSSSAAFADLNRDGDLDLYVVNYLDASEHSPRLCPHPSSPDGYLQCAPETFPAADDAFFLSDGRGAFHECARQAGAWAPDGKGLGVVVFDANGDRRPDIYVANDGTPNFLFIHKGQQQPSEDSPLPADIKIPKFQEQAALMGAAMNRHGLAEAGMGVACGDYDGDGRLDLFVTHFFLETNTLYRNRSGNGFADVTHQAGLEAPSQRMLAFGAKFFDYDNDGGLDIFVANGHVDDRRWRNEPYAMRPQIFRNTGGGRFDEVSSWAGSYFQETWLGRGVAVGDLDDDGDRDIVVSHQRRRPAVLRNDTPSHGNSVILKLIGRRSSRSPFGVRLEAEISGAKLVRQLVGGGSFLSASEQTIHVGLDDQPRLSALRIEWPSGATDQLSDIPCGRCVVIEGLGYVFSR